MTAVSAGATTGAVGATTTTTTTSPPHSPDLLELRRQLHVRLESGNLHTLRECRALLGAVLDGFSGAARQQFAALFRAEQQLMATGRGDMAAEVRFLPTSMHTSQFPSFQQQHQHAAASAASDDVTSAALGRDPVHALQAAVRQLHVELIKLIDLSEAQRDEQRAVLDAMRRDIKSLQPAAAAATAAATL